MGMQGDQVNEESYKVQVAVRLKPSVKNKLRKLSEEEGKEMSDTVRELIESYIDDQHMRGGDEHDGDRLQGEKTASY